MTTARILLDYNINRARETHTMRNKPTKPPKASKSHRPYRRPTRRHTEAVASNRHNFRDRRRARFEKLRAHRERLAQMAQDTFRTVLTIHGYHEDVLTDSDDDTDSSTNRRTSPDSTDSAQGPYHDLTDIISKTREESSFYPHYSALLADWEKGPILSSVQDAHDAPEVSDSATPEAHRAHTFSTKFEFTTSTVLAAARNACQSSPSLQSDEYGLGVLNEATPKKPGGASLSGGLTLEECLVRHTTLFDSLQNSSAGEQFYAEHRRTTDGSGLHDHSMLYSPKVAVIKNERGHRIAPYFINVISCVPVHAGTVRAKFSIDDDEFKDGVRKVMHERMARVLRLFEERGDRVLVLCPFGVGQSCNSPQMIGDIWADLLCTRGAKFYGVFERVIFALPGKHRETFEKSFNEMVLEREVFTGDFD